MDRDIDIFDRVHARPWREEPDTLLRLLRDRALERGGRCLRGQHVHLVRVLRGADLVHLSAGYPRRDRGGKARRSRLPGCAAIHIHWVPADGDHRHLGGRGHARLPRRRRAPRYSLPRGHRRALRALRLRHRQGGRHAVPPLAAGGHGRPHPGERAVTRGSSRQGRRLLRAQGHGLPVWHRSAW